MGNLNSGFGNMGRTVMTHASADMSVVKGGTNSLSSLICRVDDTGYVGHLYNTARAPILECEILDVAVMGMF